MTEATTAPTFYGVLIGADGYFPNLLSNGGSYRSLGGCVNDVLRMQAMLKLRLVGRTLALTTLIAPAGAGGLPTGDAAAWPTAANIRAALADVAERAQPGDQVLIHFAGHGGRVATAWHDLKGRTGIDEALVPIDIGRADDPHGPTYTRPERYIRDVELALYLDRLASKVDAANRGVTVTLVFDSCHSGGATRSASDLTARSATGGSASAQDPSGMIDFHPLMADAPAAVAHRAHMAAAFGRLRGPASRAIAPATSWLPPARGYVLLAACRDVEVSLEGSFDGRPRSGVLSDALLEALDTLGTSQAWKTVYDRVLAQVHSRVSSQTPQLLGDIERHVFGAELSPVEHTFAVAAVDVARREVTINAGLALTITSGTELDVYPPGTTDFSLVARRLATLTVVEAHAVDSAARLDDAADPGAIPIGAPVVVRALALRRKVELLTRSDLVGEPAARQADVLAKVAEAIAHHGQGFLAVGAPGEVPHYQVALTLSGQLEICDPRGIAFAYLEPTLRIDDPNAPRAAVAQLRRLTRYHTVLAMNESPPALLDQLQVELLAAPPSWRDEHPIDVGAGTPLVRQGDTYTVENHTWLWLKLTNREPRALLNIALLDLNRRWEIDLIVPNPNDLRGKKYESIGDAVCTYAFKMFTPVGEIVDVLKLFIARGDIDFRALSTAAARSRDPVSRGASNALNRLIDAINATEHRTRDVCSGRSVESPWAVQEIRIRTRP